MNENDLTRLGDDLSRVSHISVLFDDAIDLSPETQLKITVIANTIEDGKSDDRSVLITAYDREIDDELIEQYDVPM